MKINREFTTANQSPYESINFKKVSSEIVNPDGSLVFKLENFEVPEQWLSLIHISEPTRR